MNAPIEERFQANLARVRNIVAVYHRQVGGVTGRPSVQESDLLRAAVILLHATLEDLLRSLAEWKLPVSSPDALLDVPFAGTRKLTLTSADLAAYRGSTVDTVIAEVVRAWLERSSFNHVTEIATLLRRIGLDEQVVAPHAKDLDAMMKRRHLIAHRADRNEATGSGQHPARSIGKATVESWIAAIENFGTDLLAQV